MRGEAQLNLVRSVKETKRATDFTLLSVVISSVGGRWGGGERGLESIVTY